MITTTISFDDSVLALASSAEAVLNAFTVVGTGGSPRVEGIWSEVKSDMEKLLPGAIVRLQDEEDGEPKFGLIPMRHRMAAKPGFTRASGDAFTTRDVHDTARRMAAALQLDVARFGAKSFRTGGATDLRVVLGMAGQEYIKARGRWHSDIALIYQRAMAGDQLDGAARMGDARGDDLESMIIGWSQPAR